MAPTSRNGTYIAAIIQGSNPNHFSHHAVSRLSSTFSSLLYIEYSICGILSRLRYCMEVVQAAQRLLNNGLNQSTQNSNVRPSSETFQSCSIRTISDHRNHRRKGTSESHFPLEQVDWNINRHAGVRCHSNRLSISRHVAVYACHLKTELLAILETLWTFLISF